MDLAFNLLSFAWGWGGEAVFVRRKIEKAVFYKEGLIKLGRGVKDVLLTIAKSPRIVPGAEASGLVAPRRALKELIMLESWVFGER